MLVVVIIKTLGRRTTKASFLPSVLFLAEIDKNAVSREIIGLGSVRTEPTSSR